MSIYISRGGNLRGTHTYVMHERLPDLVGERGGTQDATSVMQKSQCNTSYVSAQSMKHAKQCVVIQRINYGIPVTTDIFSDGARWTCQRTLEAVLAFLWDAVTSDCL